MCMSELGQTHKMRCSIGKRTSGFRDTVFSDKPYHAPQNMASFVVGPFMSCPDSPGEPHGRYLQHFLRTFSGICDKKKTLHLKVVVHGGPKIVLHLVDTLW